MGPFLSPLQNPQSKCQPHFFPRMHKAKAPQVHLTAFLRQVHVTPSTPPSPGHRLPATHTETPTLLQTPVPPLPSLTRVDPTLLGGSHTRTLGGGISSLLLPNKAPGGHGAPLLSLSIPPSTTHTAGSHSVHEQAVRISRYTRAPPLAKLLRSFSEWWGMGQGEGAEGSDLPDAYAAGLAVRADSRCLGHSRY